MEKLLLKFKNHIITYPTPGNLNNLWNFGFFIGRLLSHTNYNWYFFNNALYTSH